MPGSAAASCPAAESRPAASGASGFRPRTAVAGARIRPAPRPAPPRRSPATSRSLKYSSEYAHCQSRKLLMRSSPEVRMSSSGSCISGAYRWRRKSSSANAGRASPPAPAAGQPHRRPPSSPPPRGCGSRGGLGRQPRGRVKQLAAAAVVEGDVERHPGVGCGERLGLLDTAHELLRYAVTTPDEAHACPAFVHVGHLRIYHLHEQVHERGHLVGGPVPVLGGERVHRDLADAEVEGVLEDAAQRLRAGAVARRPPAGAGAAPSARCRP